MKKLFTAALAIAAFAACTQPKPQLKSYDEEMEAFKSFMSELRTEASQPGADEEAIDARYYAYIDSLATLHLGDSVGLAMTIQRAYDMSIAELDSAMQICDLYANNEKLQRIHSNLLAAEATAAGCSYIDVAGVNASTGDSLRLSDILAQGKPVVVDFWASWCGPCRQEIKNHLSQYATTYAGKVNFVGIAVWEQGVEDTQKAMSELPISWPILFAGGRENSPSQLYGINGIPQIMLIASDGTILARDLRGEAIAEAIESALR